MKLHFDKDFNWGVATTAIQIEGGVDQDGRAPSMWPEFARRPGKVKHGDVPDHSARSYEFLTRDLDACARLNLKSYNFSASWPRLLPPGGKANQKSLDYYNRLIDGLLERGIKPDLSLYDWDLPLEYARAGGWGQRDLVERFGEYTDLLIRSFGDRVTQWMTFNEVSTQATNGYKSGNHAPGYKDRQHCLRAYHHLLLAHGKSVQQLRAASNEIEISFVDNLLRYTPATVSDADRRATDRQLDMNTYYLLDCLFKGEMRESFVRHNVDVQGCNFNHVQSSDLDIISTPFDKFGVNYFTSFVVADSKEKPGKDEKVKAAPGPKSDLGWTIDPHGLLLSLRSLRDHYTGDLPLFIGECGIDNADYVNPAGEVNDSERVDYLRQHLHKVHRAIDEGIPIKGFYVWSLMDNFEWQAGYKKRFGLFYTPYQSPGQFVIKKSGKWFAELAKTGELEVKEEKDPK